MANDDATLAGPGHDRGPAPPGVADDGPLERGATVDRYTILAPAGAGGMGEVYAAYDSKLDRRIALKVLRHRGAEYDARLTREAQAMARLSHPNVVGVFDTGIERGRLFLAMEFVEGRTLKVWRRESAPSVSEIVRVYAEAGRGLAAAHAAGLVHRDFKPDNVLIAPDGQVKVTDFGVVRAAEDDTVAPLDVAAGGFSAAGSSGPSAVPPVLAAALASGAPDESVQSSTAPGALLRGSVTEAGSVVGTPGYMAPEQYLSEPIDARTDQFAFCAALYEALYGQKPFAGEGLFEQLGSTLGGEVRPPPKGVSVAAHIHRALLRGLSREKAARYPSMHELLHELGRDPAKRRRRIIQGVAAGAIAACGLVLAQRTVAHRQGALCTGSEALAHEVWNAGVEDRARAAFAATGLPFAKETGERTLQVVDAYMAGWSEAHRAACEATRIEGSQPEPVMAVRMACLEERRKQVRAFADVLSNADRKVAASALPAALALPGVDDCRNVTSLEAVMPEPASAPLQKEIEQVREGLARVRARVAAGRYSEAVGEAEPLVGRARAIGYPPLLAEVLLWTAKARAESGSAKTDVFDLLAESAFRADIGRADEVRAEAATEMLRRLPEAGRFSEADHWSQIAEASLDRADDHGTGLAQWLSARCFVDGRRGEAEKAVEHCTAALDVERRIGSDPLLSSMIARSLAADLLKLGRNSEARERIAEADRVLRKAVGDEHPARIKVLNIRASVESTTDPAKALVYMREAIALAERTAPDAPEIPALYNNACSYDAQVGDFERARADCEIAIARGRSMWGDGAGVLPYAEGGLGDALLGLHRPADAVPQFEAVIATAEKTGATKATHYFEALEGLGRSELLTDRPAEAVHSLEQALAVAATLEDVTVTFRERWAAARYELAQALWRTGVRSGRIAELASAAEGYYREARRARDADAVAAWLRDHLARGARGGR